MEVGADVIWKLGARPASLSGFALECALLAVSQNKLAQSTTRRPGYGNGLILGIGFRQMTLTSFLYQGSAWEPARWGEFLSSPPR